MGRMQVRTIGGAVAAALVLAAVGCTPSGEATATPTEVTFGDTRVGTTSTQTLVVTNTAASGDLTVEAVVVTGPERADFHDDFDDAGAAVLAPGQALGIAVTFAPAAAGLRSATLTVKHSGADPLAVPLAGVGVVPEPGLKPLVAAPAAVDFGAVTVGQKQTADVTLTNGGVTNNIRVSAVAVAGPDAAVFTDGFTADPATRLAPGESLTVPVTFAPTTEGTFAATLVVTHSGTNAPVVVPLTGRAALGPGSVVLYRVDVGGPALAGTPAWEADTAAAPSPRGNGAATGNGTASWPQPPDLSDPSVPAGTPAALFQTERYDPAAAPDLAYSFPVPAGTPVELRVYLAEMYDGAFPPGSRVFDVVVDGHLARDDVDVAGTVGPRKALVVRLPVAADGAVDVAFSGVVGDVSVKGLEVVTTGGPAPAVLAASPSTVDLGAVPVRQRTTTPLTLTNTGASAPITVSSLTMTGPDGAMFDARVAGGLPVTLVPGASLPVTVHVLPEVSGTRTATLVVGHDGVGGSLAVPLSATAGPPVADNPGFGRSTLAGAPVPAPTSLQFGPDGRLYVAQVDGTIKIFTVARTGPGQYQATATETLTQIRAIPNHDDNGVPAPAVSGRLVTGLLVTGTADQPVIYAVSSDPRIGAGTSGQDLGLDTNSGVLSRLTKVGAGWQKTDLVRGLPRSEENHTGNGLALVPGTSILLVAYGGNTNMGAPSHNFAALPEFALSAAVLSVDLAAIGSTTYVLPTLDDEDRPGTADAGDPFGGNNGKNQARLVAGGPVQVLAPGFRNPYDLVITQAGRLYTIDNGANAGWGGAPLPDDATGACTNATVETSHTDADELIRIAGLGFYGGHPNPTRANRANTFNAANPQSPVSAADPRQCDYRTPVQGPAMATFGFSTNGLDEYTASTFGGAMQGDLLAAAFDGAIYRIQLSADGDAVTSRTVLAAQVANLPLDVTAQGDADPFPGTIWVADFDGNGVVVLEPADAPCTGADDPALDEDGDGFTNADEIANGTNPCSAADTPPDADGDHVSDRTDPDDDGDGLADAADPFAVDPANGRGPASALPVVLTWDNDATPAGGLLGLGFTGLMADGATDYLDRFDPAGMTAGGAAGVLTVDAVGDGDALGPGGTQANGFQVGLDVDAGSGPFTVHTRLPAPFSGVAPAGAQSYGLFVGDGTQDGYVKVVVAANDGVGGFALVREVGGVPTTLTVPGPVWPGPGAVDLFLHVDPAAHTVTASAAVDGGPPVAVGPPQDVPAAWFTGAAGPAAGIISTSAGPAPPFPATWDFLEAQPG
jgi:Malectin domain/Abnormal spindle-like microcephaly-assoc'd, ASPM-SPD-2-Hydin/Bacterial TSP3 repeat